MPITIKNETYLDTDETCKRLSVRRETVYRLVKEGRLPQYKQGIRRVNYYKLADVERLLDMQLTEE